jgi:hypothetical protein
MAPRDIPTRSVTLQIKLVGINLGAIGLHPTGFTILLVLRRYGSVT